MSLNGNAEIFRKRRSHLLGAIGEGAVAILPSAPVSVRSNDVEFVYRQDSDFYYLTGFVEPDSVAVFAPGHPEGEFVMFVRPRDQGARDLDRAARRLEGAMIDYGADKAYAVEEFDGRLPRYLDKASTGSTTRSASTRG